MEKNKEKIKPTVLVQDDVIKKETAEYSLALINRMDEILETVPREYRLSIVMAMGRAFETGYRSSAKFAQFAVKGCVDFMVSQTQDIIEDMEKNGLSENDAEYAKMVGAMNAYKSLGDSLVDHEEIDITPRMQKEALDFADKHMDDDDKDMKENHHVVHMHISSKRKGPVS